MNYYEVTFSCIPNEEIIKDILSSELGDIDFESFFENGNGKLCGYIPEKKYSEEAIKNLINNFPVNAEISFSSQLIPSQNWNEEWEKNFFQPIITKNICVIHGSFHQNIPSVKYDIVIDPKMSFGTGHHETTGLMIDFMLDIDLNNKSFLDMGCGTGVLAILASMKGAKPVVAIDNDEWAFNNSLENIQLNKTTGIQVKLGDASLLGAEKFNFIFANINRNILLNDIHKYASCMYSGSTLYMSGFYMEDLPFIEKECNKNGLTFNGNRSKNNWCAAKFIRN